MAALRLPTHANERENGMSLRIGIIGCGGIGRTHLAAWIDAGYTPVALCDAVPGAADALVGTTGATAYTDVAQMLATAQLDIVSICTPPTSHCALTIQALEAKAHVLVEKPMAPTVAECNAMIAAADRANRLLSVGFCHRYQPQIVALKQALHDGLIGTPMMFRNRFAGVMPDVDQRWFSDPALAGGGVIMDTCVHSVDLFRFFFGDVRRVQASATTRATELGPALRVEDTAIITLTSLDGVLGVIEASWRTAPGVWAVTVFGTTGALTMNYNTMQLVHQNAEGVATTLPIPDADRFSAEVAHFAACVQTGSTLRVTGIDGRQATAILVAAMADAKST